MKSWTGPFAEQLEEIKNQKKKENEKKENEKKENEKKTRMRKVFKLMLLASLNYWYLKTICSDLFKSETDGLLDDSDIFSASTETSVVEESEIDQNNVQIP